MNNYNILVVDDEPDILEVVKYNLKKAGFSVTCAESGEEALKLIHQKRPDTIILDLMMPGMNGQEVCHNLKANVKTSNIPVLLLTARSEEQDIVSGFELGADDYIVKPFSPKVLIARVKSLLRRSFERLGEHTQILTFQGIRIDPRRHELKLDNEVVELTSTEFRILYLLMSNAGFVYPRQKIVDEVHGVDYPVTDRSIDVQIVGLRRKLGVYGGIIETVRGVGYRFRDEVTATFDDLTLEINITNPSAEITANVG
jgi:two-component system, OmpR family, alkaline phosphatase synthesis response regulator PhoP